MRKYSKTISVILVIAMQLALITGCEKTFVKKNHTAETTARITSTKGTGCGSSGRKVTFEYTVNGKVLENLTCHSSLQANAEGLVENAQATACYDPSNPEDSVVIPTGYRCGQ
jgi:hypothetical protein